ncbi:flagellin [Halostagnicola bangensis]
MGFSTSAAVAVMLIGFLLAAGVLFPAVFAAGSDTGSAFSAQADQTRDQINTAIDISTFSEIDGEPTVVASNDGTTTIDVMKVDVLVNGVYVHYDHYTTAVVTETAGGETESNGETDIWHPGSDLEIVLDFDEVSAIDEEDVERVKLVTEYGITDSAEYEGSE